MSIRPRWLIALLTVVLMISLLPGAFAAPGPAAAPQPPTTLDQNRAPAVPARYNGSVESASAVTERKVSGSLRDLVAASDPAARLKVMVVSQGPLPGDYPLQNKVSRRPDADGLTFSFGEAPAAQVGKLAAYQNVLQLQDNRAVQPWPLPTSDRQPPVTRAERMALGRDYQPDVSRYQTTYPSKEQTSKGKDGQQAPDSWHVPDVHNVRTVWQQGIQGQGVKVAVLDSGVDFGHPDLQGTMARDENPASPYYGWPLAYDPWSMEIYNYGIKHDANTAIIGWQSWYADTSATIQGSTGRFTTAAYTGQEFITLTNTYTMPGTSRSGLYHIGVHPDEYAAFDMYGEFMAVLVVDEHTPGVYDTVYTDLNGNHDFRDDARQVKGNEVATRDTNGDGTADLSAGMIYFIADGQRPIPGGGWLYSLLTPNSGDLVAFMGAFNYGATHGTFCASSVVAQGRIDGRTSIYPPYKPAGIGGMVQGTAPQAKIIAVGDIYHANATFYDAYALVMLGNDARRGSVNVPQAASLSYGFSGGSDNGWDFQSRYLSQLNRTLAPKTTFVASAGNGGPGYGSITPPGSSPYILTVGASTQYGDTSTFEPISSTAEILSGDVQPWSNRGPTIAGVPKPDVVAVGAWGAGDVVLNVVKNGQNAWGLWGGTSMSAPVAAGIVALAAQAYEQAHGAYPDSLLMRDIVKGSADNLNYDVFAQGAGQINAGRAVQLAQVRGGGYVSPSAINVGARQGGAVGTIAPAELVTHTMMLTNSGSTPLTFNLSSDQLVAFDSITFSVTTSNTQESRPNFLRPDYLWDISDRVPPGTDLMQMTTYYPYEQFTDSNPRSPYVLGDNAWAVIAYNWRDRNRNGRVWQDANGNRTVNDGEIEPELARFDYGYNANTVVQAWLQKPRERMADGLFVGLQHRYGNSFHPTATLTLKLTFYRHTAWPLVEGFQPAQMTVPPQSSLPITVSFRPAANVAVGAHGGAIVVRGSDGHEQYVPVVANVRASSLNTRWGNQPASAASYDGNQITGSSDWDWRPDSGEWRSFYARNVDRIDDYTQLWATTDWTTFPTDLDTVLFNASPFDYFSNAFPDLFGSYAQWAWAGSVDAWAGGGAYSFQTATDTTEEWIASRPFDVQLDHEVVHHAVGYAGRTPSQPFTDTLRLVKIGPGSFDFDAPTFYGTKEITFTTGYTLAGGLKASAFGLSQEQRENDIFVQQYGTEFRYLDVHSAAALEVRVVADSDADVDLWVDHWRNGRWNQVAQSTSPGGDEYIRVAPVEDGGWRFRIDATRVPAEGTHFDLISTLIGGRNMTISPAVISSTILPGQVVTFTVGYNKPDITVGIYKGQIFLGPANAPQLASIPFTLRYGNPTPAPTDTPRPCRASFTDLTESHWAFAYIRDLVCRGAIEGYLDNTFRPNEPTSRGQFAKLLVRAEGWPDVRPTTPSFGDVPTVHWAYPYVESLREHGVANGQNGNFYPNRAISRAEAAKMAVLAAGLPLRTPAVAYFSDVPTSSPFFGYVEAARSAGLMGGYAGNYFRPNVSISRAETSKLLYLLIVR